MMTGIPPPRFFDYNWQISRTNDKGFSEGLRDIVAQMLNHRMAMRPDTLTLVNIVEDGWRVWRSTTREGWEYVDARDDFLKRVYQDARPGRSIVGL
jgi:hypothetical protein